MFSNNIPGLFNRNRADKANRPAIRPEMAPVDWLLEAVALSGAMIFLGFTLYQYPRLPEMIPSHFDGAGMPDDYSSKSSILALLGIGMFIYILMSLIALVPHQFNFTVKITPRNALKQYTLAIRLIRYLKAAIVWLFFYIAYATVRVVAKEETGLGLWFVPITMAGIIAPVIFYVIVANRQK